MSDSKYNAFHLRKLVILAVLFLSGCKLKVGTMTYECSDATVFQRTEHYLKCHREDKYTVEFCRDETEWLYCNKVRDGDIERRVVESGEGEG